MQERHTFEERAEHAAAVGLILQRRRQGRNRYRLVLGAAGPYKWLGNLGKDFEDAIASLRRRYQVRKAILATGKPKHNSHHTTLEEARERAAALLGNGYGKIQIIDRLTGKEENC